MDNDPVAAFLAEYFTEDELSHIGIKGMRWGFRKNPKGGHVKTGRAKGEKTKEAKPVSDDASSASAARAKIKKSGLASLSNQEIQSLVARQNLEQQYSRLNPSTVKRGATIAKNIISTAKTVNDVVNVVNTLDKNRQKVGLKAT